MQGFNKLSQEKVYHGKDLQGRDVQITVTHQLREVTSATIFLGKLHGKTVILKDYTTHGTTDQVTREILQTEYYKDRGYEPAEIVGFNVEQNFTVKEFVTSLSIDQGRSPSLATLFESTSSLQASLDSMRRQMIEEFQHPEHGFKAWLSQRRFPFPIQPNGRYYSIDLQDTNFRLAFPSFQEPRVRLIDP